MSEGEHQTATTAVVLAASGADDPLVRQAGVPSKALFPLGDRPLVSYLLEALREAEGVGRIVYVGPSAPSLEPLHDLVVPGGARLVDSLAAGLGHAAATGGRKLLLCASDIPWVTGPMIDRFLGRAPADAALVYPVVPLAAAARDFPDQRRTYVRLVEGRVTGGNLMLLDASLVPRLMPLVDRVYRARKNPFALAAVVGWRTLIALILGRASLHGLEARVGQILGARATALVTDDAALAADVDELAHLPSTFSPDLSAGARGGVRDGVQDGARGDVQGDVQDGRPLARAE